MADVETVVARFQDLGLDDVETVIGRFRSLSVTQEAQVEDKILALVLRHYLDEYICMQNAKNTVRLATQELRGALFPLSKSPPLWNMAQVVLNHNTIWFRDSWPARQPGFGGIVSDFEADMAFVTAIPQTVNHLYQALRIDNSYGVRSQQKLNEILHNINNAPLTTVIFHLYSTIAQGTDLQKAWYKNTQMGLALKTIIEGLRATKNRLIVVSQPSGPHGIEVGLAADENRDRREMMQMEDALRVLHGPIVDVTRVTDHQKITKKMLGERIGVMYRI